MDLENYLRFAAALVFVLALIGLATWLARWFGFGTRAPQVRGGQRRLGVVEVATIDARHRAVLLRRDDREHLVLIGPSADLLIESGIEPPSDAASPGKQPE
jgi:flagellar protein FliO/FliZ